MPERAAAVFAWRAARVLADSAVAALRELADCAADWFAATRLLCAAVAVLACSPNEVAWAASVDVTAVSRRLMLRAARWSCWLIAALSKAR